MRNHVALARGSSFRNHRGIRKDKYESYISDPERGIGTLDKDFIKTLQPDTLWSCKSYSKDEITAFYELNELSNNFKSRAFDMTNLFEKIFTDSDIIFHLMKKINPSFKTDIFEYISNQFFIKDIYELPSYQINTIKHLITTINEAKKEIESMYMKDNSLN